MDSLAKDERDLEAERLELEELEELTMMFQEADWEREYQKQLDAEFKSRIFRECDEQDDYYETLLGDYWEPNFGE